jgi:hypothetical protein
MAAGLRGEAGPGITDSGMPTGPGSPAPSGSAAARAGWTAGRIIALAAGSVLILISLVLLGGAGS